MKTIQEARELLGTQLRVHLGFFPTPLHKLEKVSRDTGVNVWIKREDFSGMTLFGGNKIRKLEYLLGDARAKGCDTVITFGATQSNHAMETATAARKCGMEPVLYLAALVEPKKEDVRANLLLDTILGAELHILPTLPGELMADTFVRCRSQVDERIAQLKAAGHKVYEMPSGGSTPVGVTGYVDSFVELTAQLQERNIQADYLFTSTGTGGTLAGLAAGKALLGSAIQIVGIQVSPKDPDGYPKHVTELANGALAHIDVSDRAVHGHDEGVVADRFYEKTQGIHLVSLYGVLRHIRHKHKGSIPVYGTQLLRHFHSIHQRHHDVHKHYIKSRCIVLQKIHAIGKHRNLNPFMKLFGVLL